MFQHACLPVSLNNVLLLFCFSTQQAHQAVQPRRVEEGRTPYPHLNPSHPQEEQVPQGHQECKLNAKKICHGQVVRRAAPVLWCL